MHVLFVGCDIFQRMVLGNSDLLNRPDLKAKPKPIDFAANPSWEKGETGECEEKNFYRVKY